MIGEETASQYLLGVAMGTLGTTFMVWVIVDPGIGLIEMLLPTSRNHRAQRLAQAKAEREKKQKDSEHLLSQVLEKEESDRQMWQEILKTQAEELAGLLTTDSSNFKQAERDAIGIGASAWQVGGLNCMRELRNMAIAIYKQTDQNKAFVDYISFWWDGIGSWRAPSLC